MDTAACSWAVRVKQDCVTYESCFAASMEEYIMYRDSQYNPDLIDPDTLLPAPIDMFNDRKAEWRGLIRMQCLIDSFGDGEVTHEEIDWCKAQAYNTDHLNLTEHYGWAIPDMFDCSYTELYPNTATYKEAEFVPLPTNARGQMDKYHCAGLWEVSTVPNDGSPDSCDCTAVVLSGTYTKGALVKCTGCIDVYKSIETNSCPVGTKIFSPQSRTDWETVVDSTELDALKQPHFIFDVTCPEDICTQNIMDSVTGAEESLRMRWSTADGSPWWLKSTAYERNAESHYMANCFMRMTEYPDEDHLTFEEDGCSYHSTSYLCQPAMAS